jgi:hypothetical protein
MGQANRLPSHFPNGTRYVIEGRAGRILARYLEFPDGRHIDLPADHAGARVRGSRPLRKIAARK